MNHPLIDKATSAWGGDLPDWVRVLSEACAQSTQSAVAKRIGYSASAISQVLSNSYRGDIKRIEQMVSGALMSVTVICPMQGELSRNICLDWQAKPYAPTSSYRVAMYRACNGGCPHAHSTTKGSEDAV